MTLIETKFSIVDPFVCKRRWVWNAYDKPSLKAKVLASGSSSLTVATVETFTGRSIGTRSIRCKNTSSTCLRAPVLVEWPCQVACLSRKLLKIQDYNMDVS